MVGAAVSLPPAATVSSRRIRSVSPPAPSAGPPTYTTSEPATGGFGAGSAVTAVAPATPRTSRTAATAPGSAFGAVTRVTAPGTVTGFPVTRCSCGRGNTWGSPRLPSGVCEVPLAVLTTSGPGVYPGATAYAAGPLTSRPPTTAAADRVAATWRVRRLGAPGRAARARSARTEGSSGEVPLRSAISRSAVLGAS